MKKVTSNEKRLADWIKRNAYSEREEGEFTKIQIRQVLNKSKSGDEVARFDIPKKEERSESWDHDLAVQIMSTLNIEASTLGGVQHYACYSIFSNFEGNVNRCIVTVAGTSADNGDDDDLLSEAPNGKGLVAQAMRHQEANARILTGGLAQILDSYRRQNERIMAINEKLITDRFEMLNDMADVYNERKQQMLTEQREDVKTQAMKEGISTVKQLAPVIINKMIGKDLLPIDKSAGVTAMAKTLFPSLSEEQHEAINKILRPDQAVQFYGIGEALIEDEPEKKQA